MKHPELPDVLCILINHQQRIKIFIADLVFLRNQPQLIASVQAFLILGAICSHVDLRNQMAYVRQRFSQNPLQFGRVMRTPLDSGDLSGKYSNLPYAIGKIQALFREIAQPEPGRPMA